MSLIFTIPLALLYGVALWVVTMRHRAVGIGGREELFP
jgi:hypothetical protein